MADRIKKLLRYLAAAFVTLLALIPFFALFQLAFNTPNHMVDATIWRLPEFTFENISAAWQKSNLARAMLNSLTITACSVALSVLFSAAAGYQIARFQTRLTNAFYKSLVFSMAIPGIISTVLLYLPMRAIGAINTRWGMVLLNATANLPFAIFLMTNFIRNTPKSMEEAAIIDGCSWFSAFFRVLFPVLTPIITTVLLLNAVSVWNEYGRSVFLLQKSAYYTIPLSNSMFIQKYSADWELMAAGALVGMLPAVAIFLSFQKYYIKGMTAGAVKG